MARIAILLGAPGAGKGTQAVRLASELGLPHVSTGDLFRENLGQDTELGRKAKGFMEAGKLVPDELVLEMLFDRVARSDCDGGYLLDGFPRTLGQAEAYGSKLGGGDSVIAVDLVVADQTIVRRASGRLLCSDCGHIQHVEFAPPKTEGVCDACGGELYQRKDDAPEVVQERLRVYYEETAPLIGFYEKLGDLHRVDGERAPDEVFRDLLRLLSTEEAV